MAIKATPFPEAKVSVPADEPAIKFVTLEEAARKMGAPSVEEMLELLDAMPGQARRNLSDYLSREAT